VNLEKENYNSPVIVNAFSKRLSSIHEDLLRNSCNNGAIAEINLFSFALIKIPIVPLHGILLGEFEFCYKVFVTHPVYRF